VSFFALSPDGRGGAKVPWAKCEWSMTHDPGSNGATQQCSNMNGSNSNTDRARMKFKPRLFVAGVTDGFGLGIEIVNTL